MIQTCAIAGYINKEKKKTRLWIGLSHDWRSNVLYSKNKLWYNNTFHAYSADQFIIWITKTVEEKRMQQQQQQLWRHAKYLQCTTTTFPFSRSHFRLKSHSTHTCMHKVCFFSTLSENWISKVVWQINEWIKLYIFSLLLLFWMDFRFECYVRQWHTKYTYRIKSFYQII